MTKVFLDCCNRVFSPDQVGCFLGDHDLGGVRVSTQTVRNYGRVDDSNPGQSANSGTVNDQNIIYYAVNNMVLPGRKDGITCTNSLCSLLITSFISLTQFVSVNLDKCGTKKSHGCKLCIIRMLIQN